MTTISTTAQIQSINPVLSLDDYDRIVGYIHDGALETDQLSQALEELRLLFQANYVVLILRIPGIEDVGLMLVAGEL